jgi:hypothetical protein
MAYQYTREELRRKTWPPGIHVDVVEWVNKNGNHRRHVIVWRENDPECSRCFTETAPYLVNRDGTPAVPVFGGGRGLEEYTSQCGACGQVIVWTWMSVPEPDEWWSIDQTVREMTPAI